MTSPPPTRTRARHRRGERARVVLAATVTGLALPSAVLHLVVICTDLAHGRPLRFVDAMSLLTALWRIAVVLRRTGRLPTGGRHRSR
jgi:hypothetical protein